MKTRLKKFSRNTVNLDTVIANVRALAEAFPLRIYRSPANATSCQYRPSKQDDGKFSGCIIGEALRASGISTAGLDKQVPRSPAEAPKGTGIAAHLLHRGFDTNDTRVMWLKRVQGAQDIGAMWRDAVRSADAQGMDIAP